MDPFSFVLKASNIMINGNKIIDQIVEIAETKAEDFETCDGNFKFGNNIGTLARMAVIKVCSSLRIIPMIYFMSIL